MGKAGSLAFCRQSHACLCTCALSRGPFPFQSHQPNITRISGPDTIPASRQLFRSLPSTSRPREAHACCQEPHPFRLCILSPLQKAPWGLSELMWLSLYCEHNRKQSALERGPCGLYERWALERQLIKVTLKRTQPLPLPSRPAGSLHTFCPCIWGLSGSFPHLSKKITLK